MISQLYADCSRKPQMADDRLGEHNIGSAISFFLILVILNLPETRSTVSFSQPTILCTCYSCSNNLSPHAIRNTPQCMNLFIPSAPFCDLNTSIMKKTCIRLAAFTWKLWPDHDQHLRCPTGDWERDTETLIYAPVVICS